MRALDLLFHMFQLVRFTYVPSASPSRFALPAVEKLRADPRFRLSEALQGAGVPASSAYARQVLSGMGAASGWRRDSGSALKLGQD